MLTVILVPLSMFIGIAASAIGFTAWPLIVPILYIICGFDLTLALFASLLVDCGNALVMTLIGLKHRQVDVRRGLTLAAFAFAWIVAGIWSFNAWIAGQEDFFRGPTGYITIIIGLIFIAKGLKKKGPGSDRKARIKASTRSNGATSSAGGMGRYLVFCGVALMAFLIGLLGIGGGMGYALSLMLFLSYPVLKATGTAMLMTFCSTLFAASGIFILIPEHAFVHSGATYLIPLMIGLSMLGTAGGAKIAYSLTERQINFLIGNVVIVAGLLATAQKYVIQIRF